MKAVTNKKRAFANREQGQAVLEYLVVLTTALMFAVGIAKVILNQMDKGVLFFGGKLEKQIKTGRLNPDVWEN